MLMSAATFSSTQAQLQSQGGDSPAATVSMQIQKTLGAMPLEQLDRIFSLAEELREEEGVYLAPRDTAQPDRRSNGGFDLMPMIVGGEEWARIEAGLAQR